LNHPAKDKSTKAKA